METVGVPVRIMRASINIKNNLKRDQNCDQIFLKQIPCLLFPENNEATQGQINH